MGFIEYIVIFVNLCGHFSPLFKEKCVKFKEISWHFLFLKMVRNVSLFDLILISSQYTPLDNSLVSGKDGIYGKSFLNDHGHLLDDCPWLVKNELLW